MPESGYLPDAALRVLRQRSETGMTALAVIAVPSATEDAHGELTPGAPTVLASNVPCSFAPAAAPNEKVTADREEALTSYLIRFPHGTSVPGNAVVTVTHTGAGAYAGVPSPLVFDVIDASLKSVEVTRQVLAELRGQTDAPLGGG